MSRKEPDILVSRITAEILKELDGRVGSVRHDLLADSNSLYISVRQAIDAFSQGLDNLTELILKPIKRQVYPDITNLANIGYILGANTKDQIGFMHRFLTKPGSISWSFYWNGALEHETNVLNNLNNLAAGVANAISNNYWACVNYIDAAIFAINQAMTDWTTDNDAIIAGWEAWFNAEFNQLWTWQHAFYTQEFIPVQTMANANLNRIETINDQLYTWIFPGLTDLRTRMIVVESAIYWLPITIMNDVNARLLVTEQWVSGQLDIINAQFAGVYQYISDQLTIERSQTWDYVDDQIAFLYGTLITYVNNALVPIQWSITQLQISIAAQMVALENRIDGKIQAINNQVTIKLTEFETELDESLAGLDDLFNDPEKMTRWINLMSESQWSTFRNAIHIFTSEGLE